MYKGREGVCQAYCSCVVEEAQANVPLEVAIQADKDLAAKNNNTPAVQKVGQVTNQCQARFPQAQAQPQPAQKGGARKPAKTTQ